MSKSSPSRPSARVPKLVLPSSENVIPQGGQSWGNYWTLITAMAVLLFVIYIAANGQIAAWLKLFVYATPSSVQPGSAQTGVRTPSTTGSPSLANSALASLMSEGFVDPSAYPSPTPGQGSSPATQASPVTGTIVSATFSELEAQAFGAF